ncbi:MAG: hypothetical protein HQK60_08585 [Deltaproteobacteria bacterium]|nr:hypothetical protein [Deltaproteobacteria bacterium]
MTSDQEIILKTAKEIVIKYIETGRLSASSFDESFKAIYQSIKETVEMTGPASGPPPK